MGNLKGKRESMERRNERGFEIESRYRNQT